MFIDDLPQAHVSPMRAKGEITATSVDVEIVLAGRAFTVGVAHRYFPNGGDWAYLVCPGCGRRGRKLWLLDGAPRCRWCCQDRGVRWRIEPMSVHKRAAIQAPKLLARLTSGEPARLHSRPGRVLDNRVRLEEALNRNLRVLRRRKLRSLTKTLEQDT